MSNLNDKIIEESLSEAFSVDRKTSEVIFGWQFYVTLQEGNNECMSVINSTTISYLASPFNTLFRSFEQFHQVFQKQLLV